MSFLPKILFVIGFITISTTGIEYSGYKVFNVVPRTEAEINVLEQVRNDSLGEFWDDQFDVNHVVKVMVGPTKQTEFMKLMSKENMDVEQVIEDVQRAINDQLNPRNSRNSESILSFSWDKYHSLPEIYAWLDELAASYPEVIKTVVMGNSVENRQIKGVIIDFHPERENKMIGMLEGTLHAREWISAATVTYIIKEFLTSRNAGVRALADNFQWHIFPVVNPDGYTYTFTTNRMWRKNRSTENYKTCADGNNDMSNGVDLNRNFGFQWMTVGASDDSCSNTYAGPTANSEPETRAIINYVNGLKTKGTLMYYIAFHSYTQLIIVPYSHLENSGNTARPDNFADMYEVAIRGGDALAKKFGTTYTVGVSGEVMYMMSGTSFDWVKYDAKVPFSYLIELRDLGRYGFLLPADQIIPTGQETVDALVGMDKAAIDLGYYESSASGILYSATMILLGFLVSLFSFHC